MRRRVAYGGHVCAPVGGVDVFVGAGIEIAYDTGL